MPLTPRQRELAARHLLAYPEQIPVYLKHRRWDELAALVDFAAKDASLGLVHTDPALYRLLRQQITEFRLRGWTCLNLKALQELARSQTPKQP
jgi:hypothetical protein